MRIVRILRCPLRCNKGNYRKNKAHISNPSSALHSLTDTAEGSDGREYTNIFRNLSCPLWHDQRHCDKLWPGTVLSPCLTAINRGHPRINRTEITKIFMSHGTNSRRCQLILFHKPSIIFQSRSFTRRFLPLRDVRNIQCQIVMKRIISVMYESHK